jgi:hypothetical protein
MFGHRSINSFSELNWDSFQDNIFKEIDEELLRCSDDYILNVNVEDFISYLTEKYKLEPLNILLETEEIDTPKEIRQDLSEVQPYSILTRCGTRYRNGYQIKISYSFTGSTVLFSVRPNPFTMTSYEINVEDSSKKVSFYIQIFSQDVEKFKNLLHLIVHSRIWLILILVLLITILTYLGLSNKSLMLSNKRD